MIDYQIRFEQARWAAKSEIRKHYGAPPKALPAPKKGEDDAFWLGWMLERAIILMKQDENRHCYED